MLLHYPVVIELLCGGLVGIFGGITLHCHHGKTILVLSAVAAIIARVVVCGPADMDAVLDHLLLDISQVITWTTSHQALTLGFTLGLTVTLAGKDRKRLSSTHA